MASTESLHSFSFISLQAGHAVGALSDESRVLRVCEGASVKVNGLRPGGNLEKCNIRFDSPENTTVQNEVFFLLMEKPEKRQGQATRDDSRRWTVSRTLAAAVGFIARTDTRQLGPLSATWSKHPTLAGLPELGLTVPVWMQHAACISEAPV